jgi:hypothetical protein
LHNKPAQHGRWVRAEAYDDRGKKAKEWVRFLVGKREGGTSAGYWARFEGRQVGRYEDKGVIFTLYSSTAGPDEGYRVHVLNETNPKAPTYELLPVNEDSLGRGTLPDYSDLYAPRDIAEQYPLFIKDIDYLRTYEIDPTAPNP